MSEIKEVRGTVERVERPETPEPNGWTFLAEFNGKWSAVEIDLMGTKESVIDTATGLGYQLTDVRLVRIGGAPVAGLTEEEREALTRLAAHHLGGEPDPYSTSRKAGVQKWEDWIKIRALLSRQPQPEQQGEAAHRFNVVVMEGSSRTSFRFLVRRGSEHWIAQCLENHLGTEVDDMTGLPEELAEIMCVHFDLSRELGKDPLTALQPVKKDRASELSASWNAATDVPVTLYVSIPSSGPAPQEQQPAPVALPDLANEELTFVERSVLRMNLEGGKGIRNHDDMLRIL